ncbi:unnamed protein product [Cyclocybe aegerita]|uniref:Reverse transcriptase domain-containing protein n=1 Tax=Cyclocybe aegerita TaxID=1973307 RepID=A0A8S0WD84_CYCAE|nr:unnamed protein product [Cyclocybe aegerita]
MVAAARQGWGHDWGHPSPSPLPFIRSPVLCLALSPSALPSPSTSPSCLSSAPHHPLRCPLALYLASRPLPRLSPSTSPLALYLASCPLPHLLTPRSPLASLPSASPSRPLAPRPSLIHPSFIPHSPASDDDVRQTMTTTTTTTTAGPFASININTIVDIIENIQYGIAARIDSDSSRASRVFPSINHDMFMAVLHKQGFSPILVEFFASYLVGRSTVYCWNTFQSDSRSADVGIGQGSALLPVISGLFIALVMKLFYIKAVPLNTMLLSFVDDGTILAQSKQLHNNNTKLFHVSRQRDACNPLLDLGYAPHTGATPLKPKTFWRYLGFYFDCGLTFHEHICYYATKAFTTVQAMCMLGNSTRGLSPKQRRLIYRSCVVPIATYGYRLWYFDGARCAFCTSPTGGLEALATLSDTHPLCSMMGEGLLKQAAPHACSATLMTPAMRGKVKSTVMEVDERVHTLTESFEPFAPKARPGNRLLDRYVDRLHFDERDPAQDKRPYLDELIAKARANPLTVLAATDGSVPQSNQYQATSAAIIYKGHRKLERTCYVSGRVTAPDAELNAISCAVRLAVKQANCQHIMVFTDSMGLAHTAVDPSMHSEWFEADDLHRITFVYVPSAMWWDIHGEAHKYVAKLKVRVGRRKMDNSIDTLCSQAAHSVLDSWSSTFQDPTYRGSEFLELQQPDGRPLQPSYLSGGPWLSTLGHSITEFARVCQCITGHTPIGAYYRHLKINEPHGCTCRAALQSRQHVLFRCHDRYSVHFPRFLRDIASFMKYNPTAFGFNRDPSGVG